MGPIEFVRKLEMAALPGQLGDGDQVISDQPKAAENVLKLPVGLDELNRTDRIIVQQMAGG